MAKRFYWLKLKQTFFNDLRIKKLRREQDGDSLVLVYIEILLLSLETDGRLYFDGVESNICEEIALGLDRDVSMVQKLLQLLEKGNLLEWDGNDIILTQIPEMTGSESESAVRMRRLRCVKNETEASQCDENVRKCDKNVTLERREENREDKEQSREETRAPSPCMIDLADDDHDYQKLWDFTFSIFPKKSGEATARQLWVDKLIAVLPENRYSVAKLIYEAEKEYLDDYSQKNRDDPDYKYIPKFAKWLSDDAVYWLKIAEQKQSGG